MLLLLVSHCHAWMALLETLNAVVEESGKEIITKHVQEFCQSPSTVACVVHVCRIKKCFSSDKDESVHCR